jgi:hypothetical protein
MISSRYKCGKCKSLILWETHGIYYAIGVPYLSCENCGTVNDRSYRRNEWDLMKWSTKLLVYGTTALWGVFFGFGAGAAIPEIAKEKLGWTLWGSVGMWAVGGAAIGVLMFRRWQEKAIQESRHRLSSESYKQTLLRLGIAAGSISNIKGSPTEMALFSPRRMVILVICLFAAMAIFVVFAMKTGS